MNSACPAAVFEADIGAINGMDSGDTDARQGSHSAQLWGSGWGKSSASPTRLSRRAGKPGRQQRGKGNRTRPQQEGWTEMSQDIVKAMDDLYSNVSFKPGKGSSSSGGSHKVSGTSKSGGFPGGRTVTVTSNGFRDDLCNLSRGAIVGGAAASQYFKDPRAKAASGAMAGLGTVGQNIFCR